MTTCSTEYGRFSYFTFDTIGGAIATGVFWDAWLRPYFDQLGPEDVFVDVGANIGFFTVYAARARKAWVHAFEPSPEVFELLKQNIEENGIESRVKLYDVALCDGETELCRNPKFTDLPELSSGKIDYEHYHNSGCLSLVPGKDSSYIFASKTMDSFRLPRVDLIKLDVQGMELKVLQGAKETILNSNPVICFEYDRAEESFEAYETFFGEIGYQPPMYVGGVDYVALPRRD